ncbi:N-6 DNA methylase [Streptosporangium sp. NBC_01755]|uniref:N-6 DNA methylase n=1 Tax=unclassified Streptosporangium TaxID=2632669 RepID=UPI002DDB1A76|nr:MULTISPECIES: N-6 DNA methylase [unclassified Streptosporangium]WSA27324.1 N-6 DNA methylase [Streptosporangium sp. NBC_01810]WSD01124.1 N-6 DNA methylase [Streptosporangium sp. NBC_01755]
MNADSQASADSLVSAAEIAKLAGVTRAAVSNWRRRHADFPTPVGGGAHNALFALSEVQTWLDRHRRGGEVSGEVLVWQALRGMYGDDMTRGLADVAELFTTGSAPSLDAGIRSPVKDLAAQSSPAEVVAGLTERLIDSAGRVGSEQVSTSRLTRAVRHFAGSVSGTVFDPACGIGSLLLALGNGPEVTLAGQEIDSSAARLAESRTRLAGRTGVTIRVGDSLREDHCPELRADLVVCDPPVNVPDWGREDLLLDARWEFGVPTRAEGELAWLQHCYAHVAPGGRAIFVASASAAYRKAGRRIRAELVRHGILTQLVALPAGMVASHAQPVHLWLLARPSSPDGAASFVRMTDLTANDPDGPFAPAPDQVVDVALIDLLDETVDLTPARHIAAARTDHLAEYTSIRAALVGRLHELLDLLPPLSSGPGYLEGATVRVADLARAKLVEIVEGEAVSTSDQLDTDYLHGFLRSTANTRHSTSASGGFRTDIRGSRIPQMSIDDQRLYGTAFRTLDEFERRVRELTELSDRATSLARDGLTGGALRPRTDR